jgi:hypothetical protein
VPASRQPDKAIALREAVAGSRQRAFVQERHRPRAFERQLKRDPMGRRSSLLCDGIAVAAAAQPEVFMKSIQRAAVLTSSIACFGALVACSGAPGTGPAKETGGEKTGTIVAAVTAPNDVMCIELVVNDYDDSYYGYGSSGSYYSGTFYSYTDVTPGTNATIQIGPLSPGYVYLSGDAFDAPCSVVQDPYGYGGSSSGPVGGSSTSGSSGVGVPIALDAGVGPVNPTWEADETQVLVAPGAPTAATVSFHQFGSLNLNVDFQNCDPNSTAYQPWCYTEMDASADAATSSSSSSGGSSSGTTSSGSSSGGLSSSSSSGGSSSGTTSSGSSSGGKVKDAGAVATIDAGHG